jgi:hypothetical protein
VAGKRHVRRARSFKPLLIAMGVVAMLVAGLVAATTSSATATVVGPPGLRKVSEGFLELYENRVHLDADEPEV